MCPLCKAESRAALWRVLHCGVCCTVACVATTPQYYNPCSTAIAILYLTAVGALKRCEIAIHLNTRLLHVLTAHYTGVLIVLTAAGRWCCTLPVYYDEENALGITARYV